jgi:hypothetical protein
METCQWASFMGLPALVFAFLAGFGVLAWGCGQYAKHTGKDPLADKPEQIPD